MTLSLNSPAGTLLAVVLAFGLTGCWPSKAEHDALRAEHDALKAEHETLQADLISWSGEVEAWEGLTQNVICDIIANNPQAGYAQETKDYCPNGGPEGDGDPPEPPGFGG